MENLVRGRQAIGRRLVWVGFAAAIAVSVTVWAATRQTPGPPIPFRSPPPGLTHVHGLGVNRADGALFVATHFGTFRVPDQGEAERVGDSYQDTMGFTVVGADHFLGSGHPDLTGFQQGQPPLLGLIESTDGAATWRSVSLSGEVDFHALSFRHGMVYGWDASSGRFMVSTDKETWESRSVLQLYGFAVDPEDPDHLVGASPDGQTESHDGGATWQPMAGPSFFVLAWDAVSGLWGGDLDGVVSRSTDGDVSWNQAGRLPGPPQALVAEEGVLFAAASEGSASVTYRSGDDGQTWELRYRDR